MAQNFSNISNKIGEESNVRKNFGVRVIVQERYQSYDYPDNCSEQHPAQFLILLLQVKPAQNDCRKMSGKFISNDNRANYNSKVNHNSLKVKGDKKESALL